MSHRDKIRSTRNRGFTIVELIVAATLSGLVLAGVMSSFLMFVRSSIRIANYDAMEAQATRGLEFLARDTRMAQAIVTDAPTGIASSRNIQQITLTLPTSGAGTTTVIYQFTNTNTFTRKVGAAAATTLITDIVPGSGHFYAYNLDQNVIAGTNKLEQTLAANDYETNQIQISMTTSPNTQGNYASTTKRVISARFVLRNR
jgi:prepilin-type N-terminal cleavage/methylation domain-containing protein